MKARYSYPLLFFLPSAMVAFLAAFVVVGAGAGVLWIFVYGDNPWPKSADMTLMVLATAASVVTFALLATSAYSFGKSREATGGLSTRHIVIAITASIVIPALVLLQQWQVGNLGQASAG
jgi:hypothetical protein